jgi:glutamyl-tRNA reductase
MDLVCLGINHQTAPVEVRERMALNEAMVKALLQQVTARPEPLELVVLSTCNRTEFYAVTSDAACFPSVLADMLCASRPDAKGDIPQLSTRHGLGCVEHLFRVASGLDSMVLGETEIFGQVKQAYELACTEGAAGKVLHRLFQSCFRSGKAVRTRTEITRGSVSVGSSAVELAARIFGNLEECSTLLLGAGDTAEKAARSLVSRGVTRLVVANRTEAHGAALASSLNGQAIPFDAWPDAARDSDIIISATSAPGYVIEADAFAPIAQHRGGRPVFLIDLAVPRDIDPSIASLDGVYLYNIDDLQVIAEQHLAERRSSLAKAEEIVAEHVLDFSAWWDRHANPTPPSP